MKYIMHVEANVILEFIPWEGCRPDDYAEQIGMDVFSKPGYAQDQVTIEGIFVEIIQRPTESKP
jgi:hypothetical protein